MGAREPSSAAQAYIDEERRLEPAIAFEPIHRANKLTCYLDVTPTPVAPGEQRDLRHGRLDARIEEE